MLLPYFKLAPFLFFTKMPAKLATDVGFIVVAAQAPQAHNAIYTLSSKRV